MILKDILQAFLREENREAIVHLLKGLQERMCFSASF